jgi:general secretion pathway protein K
MELIPPPKNANDDSEKDVNSSEPTKNQSGIALFMVISAISLLSIIVTEFTYISQINQRMAYDSLDQVKAHYLAKSGLKLSLLRLKAYQQVKSLIGGSSTGANSNPLAGAVPRSIVEKIWNFPFFYPIPVLPGMTGADKEKLDQFTKDSSLDGRYSATIESESSKYNLNMLLAQYQPSGSPSASPSPSPGTGTTAAAPTPTPSSSFSSEDARQSLQDYLSQLIAEKVETDDGFAHDYKDFKVDELVQNISAWADRSYKQEVPDYKDELPKGAPFYNISELHMIPTMDDDLYDLFSPNLTVTTTPGININTMKEATLRAIVPQVTAEESTEFFKFRDSTDEDNTFKKEQDFWDYIQKNVAAFRNDKNQIQQAQQALAKKNVRLVLDETQFKITVQATVNQAVRQMEAWVTLTGAGTTPNPTASGSPTPRPSPSQGANGQNTHPDAGLKITFMRIL